MIRTDVLAYLWVLGHRMSEGEAMVARTHVLGCLHRVVDQIVAEGRTDLAAAVSHREKLNGQHPHGYPALDAATAQCISMLVPLLDEDADARRAVQELEMQLAGTSPTALSEQCEAMFDWLRNKGSDAN